MKNESEVKSLLHKILSDLGVETAEDALNKLIDRRERVQLDANKIWFKIGDMKAKHEDFGVPFSYEHRNKLIHQAKQKEVEVDVIRHHLHLVRIAAGKERKESKRRKSQIENEAKQVDAIRSRAISNKKLMSRLDKFAHSEVKDFSWKCAFIALVSEHLPEDEFKKLCSLANEVSIEFKDISPIEIQRKSIKDEAKKRYQR